MWKSFGEGVLRYRLPLSILLIAATVFMGWHASQVKLSYEFSRAIPTDNPKYITYQNFKKQFGEDGNLLVIGVQTQNFFKPGFFNDYRILQQNIKKVTGVEDVLSVPAAVNLIKNEATEKLQPTPIFRDTVLSQSELDSSAAAFYNLPFYQGLLYNPQTHAWLMGVHVNKDIMSSPKRSALVEKIVQLTNAFEVKQGTTVYLSGLPLIRTMMANKIQREMKWFTLISLALSALILLLFFRSLSAMALSLAVVIIGVIWSFGTMHLLGYNITLLTALIPPLIVVIGIPNCIYFLNKYHTSYKATENKQEALVQMIAKMGVVTLFCNIAAAIGFAVFALTKSQILKEFGVVSGINIMLLFFISLILIPAVLSVMAVPKARHVKYLESRRLQRWLDRLEGWSLDHRKTIYAVTAAVLVVAILGIFRLKSVGYIVDDLPKTDKIYTDLKFFETHFRGVMPLEIVVDTKKKYGVSRNLNNLNRIDTLTQYLASRPYIGKPLTITEGLKFAKQAFFEGDSLNYTMPSEYDLPALAQYLQMKQEAGTSNSFTKLVNSFMDKDRQLARISVNMQDVGSARLPLILDSIQQQTNRLFDTAKYNVQLTGSSVTFLEGSRYIINGLKESIFWAFLLIALCMLYLFRSGRILLCSLLPNIVPLVITAGVMGWVGVPLKPSTVLVFSVALGIAIDITIRFLVNYKQDQKQIADTKQNVIQTIHSTGLSIIYTSIVLIAGFIIFCFSGFGGTQSLGWLTSLTLVVATVANLTLLPALLISLTPSRKDVRQGF
ncbi:efflux RND transporter permease subunit [Flavisolibacter tropicus]|uniref:RND transporter n=1 Tax=Flavisolibacter tropicus TaxID=1492898 RepID=A0A172TZ05_9BACT|nr:MMPL family transporter [Flavisolibacter tropicus]ANE52226.1 RND transporter [Flavisolibacter tropicus]